MDFQSLVAGAQELVSSPYAFKQLSKVFEEELRRTGLLERLMAFRAGEVSFCGRSFQRGELLYHCLDCALDETCVLCERCFNYEVHKEHRFWYSICTDSNGSCDCGEADSWTANLSCSLHSTWEATKVLEHEPLVASDAAVLTDMLHFVCGVIRGYVGRGSPTSSPYCLVLYNDERHTFEEVIQILVAELSMEEDVAACYASVIDEVGFATVYHSMSTANCERVGRKVSITGLETEVLDERVCCEMLTASVVFNHLVQLASSNPLLRSFILPPLLEPFSTAEDVCRAGKALASPSNVLELWLVCDHALWKGLRKGIHELLNLCNSVNLDYKLRISESFCRLYEHIFDCYWREKREPQLSICHFSVQLFTLTPTAVHCSKNTNVLEVIFGKMGSILDSGYKDKIGLRVQAIRHFSYSKFSVLIHDALHLLRNIKDYHTHEVASTANIDAFCYCLYLLTHMESHVRKSDRHVLYDRDNYDEAVYVIYELMKVGQELAKFITAASDLSSVWTRLDQLVMQSDFYRELLSSSTSQLEPLYMSKRRCSFYGPLTWFWSMILYELQAADRLEECQPPSRLVKVFTLDSLARLVFSAETRCGLWVRNGSVVVQQEYFYSQTPFHHLTYLGDVFCCWVGSKFLDRSYYLDLIVRCSSVVRYLDDFEQNYGIVEQLVVLVFNVICSKKLAIDHKQILTNALSMCDGTRAKLVRSLPLVVEEDKNFKAMTLSLANLVPATSLGSDAVLQLKSELDSQYDPFYWAVTMPDRIRAWIRMTGEGRFDLSRYFEHYERDWNTLTEHEAVFDAVRDLFIRLSKIGSQKAEFCNTVLLALLARSRSIVSTDHKEVVQALERLSSPLKKDTIASTFIRKMFGSLLSDAHDESKLKPSCDIGGKKRGLLNKFKQLRRVYIPSADEDLPSADSNQSALYCCVVCSESADTADNQFQIPVQIVKSSIVRFTGPEQASGSFVKGCCHVMHASCWKALPFWAGSKVKRCPLCSGAADMVIPVLSSDISFNLAEDNAMHCSASHEALASSSDEPLVSALVYTVIALIASDRSIDLLQSQQVSTLNFVRCFLLTRCQYRVDDYKERSKPSSFRADCEQLVALLCSFYRKEVQYSVVADFQDRLAGLLSAFDSACSSKLVRVVSVLVGLMTKGTLTGSTYFADVQSRDMCSVETPYIVPDFASSYRLVDLPDRYDLVLRTYMRRSCDRCGTVPRSPAVCLVCGAFLCAGDKCCRELEGECTTHRQTCSGTVGIFLLVRTAALLLLADNIGFVLPAPYVNCFGEHDLDLRSDFALELEQDAYCNVLQTMWLGHDLRDFVYRSNSDIPPNGRLIWRSI